MIHSAKNQLEESMQHAGRRLTPQRREVLEVLLSQRDHPTAVEVFLRVKSRIPSISLATVYNCLETLVKSGLVRQVNVERDASRYCPNLQEHSHFICEKCGKVFDIPLQPQAKPESVWQIPKGFKLTSFETTMRGTCSHCSK